MSMTERRAPRYFTPDEANALLEHLRPLVAQMMDAHGRIAQRLPDVEVTLERHAANGGGRVAGDLLTLNDRLQVSLRAIQSCGVLVKDAHRGLLDFPALREGRKVFLCWLYGEQRVGHWHEVDEGFYGRQPL